MPRVAAIGLDAAEWSFVKRLLDAGDLPNLAALRARSAECRLKNVLAYRAELAWPQFVTGLDAASMRYWSPIVFEPSTYTTYSVGAPLARPFYAAGAGRTIVFDVPYTVLSNDVEGVQVTGWGGHDPQYPRASRPAGLLTEIDTRFGPHPNYADTFEGAWYQPDFYGPYADRLLTGAARRMEIVEWLLDRERDWELFLTVMSESHSAGHKFWHGVDDGHPLSSHATAPMAREKLLAVYGALDAAVGRFVSAVPDDAVLVVYAVHGMCLNHEDVASQVVLPELLHRWHGAAPSMRVPRSSAWKRRGYPPVEPDVDRRLVSEMKRRFATDPRQRLKRDIRLLTPDALLELRQTVRRRAGRGQAKPQAWGLREDPPPETEEPIEEIESGLRQVLDWQVPCWYRPAWPNMRAFALPSFSDGHVRINLRGRERDGVVDRDDYAAVCREVEGVLRACRDTRTGRPAVREVIHLRADEPLAPDGPGADLVVLWAEAVDAVDHPRLGTVGPFPFIRSGEHTPDGFALVAGPGVPRADLGERSAFDLPPTILRLLGKPAPPGMVGRSFLDVVVR